MDLNNRPEPRWKATGYAYYSEECSKANILKLTDGIVNTVTEGTASGVALVGAWYSQLHFFPFMSAEEVLLYIKFAMVVCSRWPSEIERFEEPALGSEVNILCTHFMRVEEDHVPIKDCDLVFDG